MPRKKNTHYNEKNGKRRTALLASFEQLNERDRFISSFFPPREKNTLYNEKRRESIWIVLTNTASHFSNHQLIGANMRNNKRNYGMGSFLLDAVLTIASGGFWLIWVFVREMRGQA